MTETANHSAPSDATEYQNPYLTGNYAPVHDEVEAHDLEVVGSLPAELCGRYLRNGPNPAGVFDGSTDPRTHHWFMGDGMVHGLRLDEGRAAWYRNRYVGSLDMSARRDEPDIAGPNWSGSGLGANTNVVGFAAKTWALVEAGGTPVELSYELETVARNDFNGTLPGAFTAHPKIDPVSGEMHAMVYAPSMWFNRVQYVVVGTDGRVRKTVDIELPGVTMMHDMALTERYAICWDQPVIFDADRMSKGYFPLSWQPDYGNRLGLLPRGSGGEGTDDIIWIDVPIGYCFHPLNAFDRVDHAGRNKVVIDLCLYEVMFDRDRNGPFEDGRAARLERWELDPVARTCSATTIDDRSNEFPRHRDSVTARPYRYGYCASPSANPLQGWPTLKQDLESGTTEVFDHGPGRAGGEPVFVPRESVGGSGGEEDDGWLVMFVHDLNEQAAEFAVLDAQDLGRGYVARVPLPQRVPYGFHGNWVSDVSVPPTA